MGIALKKIENKLKEVTDQKQQTILTQPNGTTPYIAPHHTGTPYINPFTITCTTDGMPFKSTINNTNIS